MDSAPTVLYVGEEESGLVASADEGPAADARNEITAKSVPAALERLSETPVDCVVVGGPAAEADALTAVEMIRDAHPELPLLCCTGDRADVTAPAAISAGATDVVRPGAEQASSLVLRTRIDNVVENDGRAGASDSEDRYYQQLISNTTDLIGVVEPDGSLSYLNPASKEVLGWPPDEILGRSFADYVHPEDRPLAEERFETVTGDGTDQVEVEIRVETDDGWRWLEVHARNLTDMDDVGGIVISARDVTDRRDRERELELFETFVENANDGIYATDAEGRYTFVNTRVTEATGYDPEELIGEPVSKLVPEADIEGLHSSIRSMLSGDRESLVTETAISCADGSSIPVEVNITPLVIDGEFEGTVGIARDISSRKRRERRLNELHRATQSFLAATEESAVADSLLEAAETAIDSHVASVWLYDDEAGALVPETATDAYVDLLGSPEPLTGGESQIWRAFENGSVEVYDDRDEASDGNTSEPQLGSELLLPFGTYGLLRVGAEEPAAIDELGVSIARLLVETGEAGLARLERETELRDKRHELEREIERIEALHAVAVEMKTLDDRGEIYERVVDAAEEILEFNISLIDEVEDGILVPMAVSSGMSLEDYYQETPIEAEDNLGAETCRTRESFVVDDLHEAGYVPANFEYASALSVPIDGLGMFQAVSEEPAAFDDEDRRLAELLVEHAASAVNRLERERALQERAAELEEQNERLDHFASIVSHDLQNPLSVVRGRLDLARTTGDAEHFESIEAAVDQMEELIEGLLMLVREGESAADRTETDLATVAEAVWEDVDSGAVRLAFDDPPTLRGDTQHLRQILENLFRNSVEHAGDVSTITVGATESGFYVADDGRGIPESDRSLVFEFGHSDGNSTGVGLSIVETLAEANGLSVSVTDADSGGARFEFSRADE